MEEDDDDDDDDDDNDYDNDDDDWALLFFTLSRTCVLLCVCVCVCIYPYPYVGDSSLPRCCKVSTDKCLPTFRKIYNFHIQRFYDYLAFLTSLLLQSEHSM